jgi:hypothetical protein
LAKPIRYCAVPGCAARCKGQGMCTTHYMRQRRHGSTDDRPRGRRPKTLTVCRECGKPEVGRGLCRRCYATWLRHGEDRPRCTVDGCERPRYSKGLCSLHYGRTKRTKRVAGTSRLTLKSREERFWAKVNKAGPIPGAHPELGPCWEFTAGKGAGYGRFQRWLAHRFSYELVHGPLPKGVHVHHRCEYRSCVNPAHLKAIAADAHAVETWISTLRSTGYTVIAPA